MGTNTCGKTITEDDKNKCVATVLRSYAATRDSKYFCGMQIDSGEVPTMHRAADYIDSLELTLGETVKILKGVRKFCAKLDMDQHVKELDAILNG